MDDLTPEELERHRTERAENNFSTRDIWNFFVANAQAQVTALAEMRDMAHGYPSEFVNWDDESDHSGFDKWINIINKMIDGWQSILDEDELTIRPYDESKSFLENVNTPVMDEQYENYRLAVADCQRRFREGMALYVNYYRSLWD